MMLIQTRKLTLYTHLQTFNNLGRSNSTASPHHTIKDWTVASVHLNCSVCVCVCVPILPLKPPTAYSRSASTAAPSVLRLSCMLATALHWSLTPSYTSTVRSRSELLKPPTAYTRPAMDTMPGTVERRNQMFKRISTFKSFQDNYTQCILLNTLNVFNKLWNSKSLFCTWIVSVNKPIPIYWGGISSCRFGRYLCYYVTIPHKPIKCGNSYI